MNKRMLAFEHKRARTKSKQIVKGIMTNSYDGELKNTAGTPLAYLNIKGQTKQKCYKGYNVYNAISYKSSTSYGVTVTCKNNIFTVQGTAIIDASIIPIQIPIELLPNVTYTGRITKISGELFPKSLSFFIYKKKPSLTWNAVFGSLSSASTNASVGQKAFTQEEIDSELVGGLCFSISEGQSVDYTVRLDIIEGDYTRDTMPEYEPYVGNLPSPSPDYPQVIESTVANIRLKDKVISTSVTLGGLGDYSEALELDRASMTLKKHPCIEKYIFTGNEEFTKDEESRYLTEINSIKKQNTPILCTHFLPDATENAPYVEMNEGVISLCNTQFTSIEELKSFLKSNTVEIYYVGDYANEIDYSKEAIAKELFEIITPYDENVSLEILGDASCSEIYIKYQTLEEEK